MLRLRWVSMLIAIAAILLSATGTLGHGEDEGATSLVLEPSSVSPGGTVLIVGTELEPDDERMLQLRGEDLVLGLGTSTTTTAGRLNEEVAIPAFLPAGVYQVEVIGDETLTVELQVVGAPEDGAAVVVSTVADEGSGGRSVLELSLVLAIALVAGAVGLFLVLRAEKLVSASA